MLSALRLLLAGAAIAYLGRCGLLFLLQRSLIYFPPAVSADRNASVLTLPTTAARVLVSTIPRDSPRAVIYFGGNAEDVALDVPAFAAGFPDSAIYLLHYRGYGGRSGRPSEAALFSDALTLFDEVYASHPEVELVGRSLGSGIAVYAASLRPVTRLVLVTPFDSLQEIAARQYPFIPVRWLLQDKFESWRFAPRVSAPTLIVAAEHDEIVPLANSKLLLSRFKSGVATLTVVAGRGHNTISESPEYLKLLQGNL